MILIPLSVLNPNCIVYVYSIDFDISNGVSIIRTAIAIPRSKTVEPNKI